jgi:hypothetical protein
MSAPQPRKPISSQGEGDGHLSKFAAELGAPWLDPLPPAQYLTFADEGYEPWLRVWATILACTIAVGCRSPFAIDRRTKKPVYIEDIARRLNMDEGNARRALRRLIGEGRIRRDDEGRLWLAGDFKIPVGPQPVKPEDDPEEALKRSVTDLFKPYYVRQIMKLKPHLIRELVESKQKRIEKSRFRYADLVAAGRLMDDREDNTMMAQYGVKLIREEHDLPLEKKAAIEARRNRAEKLVPLLEKHVQTFYEEVCNNTENAMSQTAPGKPVSAVTPHRNGSSKSASRVLSENTEKGKAAVVGSSNSASSSGFDIDLKEKECGAVHSENRTTLSSLSDERTEELRALLIRWLGAKLAPELPGPPVLAETLAALEGATFASLAQRIQARIDSITSYWMVVRLAQDAAKLAQAPKTETQSKTKAATRADKFAEEYNARKSNATGS